jgi:regulator of sigma E protease
MDLSALLVFIIILGLLVALHELGHFTVARLVKMRVEEFAVGFPPRIVNKVKDGIRYSVGLLPLGGYVRIYGEHGEDLGEPKEGSFNSKSTWARLAVMLAGVAMNFLIAFVIFMVAFTIGFSSIGQRAEDIPGAKEVGTKVYITDVLPASAAEQAGIAPGSEIIRISGITVSGAAEEVRRIFADRQKVGELATEVVIRDLEGIEQTKKVQLSPDGFAFGAALQGVSRIKVPVVQAPMVAAREISLVGQLTSGALRDFGAKLLRAELDENVSGPVGIYRATRAATRQGFEQVVFLAAVLSVNLGILNLVPIPALDGGKVVFILLEMIARRRVVNHHIEGIVTTISFVLVLGLMALLTVRDIFFR